MHKNNNTNNTIKINWKNKIIINLEIPMHNRCLAVMQSRHSLTQITKD